MTTAERAGGDLLPVTAVVCARNRASSIGACIEAVRACRPERILVVDGESTDRTVDAARLAGADVITDGGAGLGAARRLGAQASRSAWVAFVDSDTRVVPSTLADLIGVAEEGPYDAVQAELRSSTASPTYWQREEIWRRRLQERPGPAQIIGCQATLVRRSLLESVPFDDVFNGAAEDHDWCFRALAHGARLAHTDRALAYHEDRADLPEFARQRFWYGRGMTRLAVRHGRVAPQIHSASVGIWRAPSHLPFMTASWGITALGMATEALNLWFRRRGVLARLRRPGSHSGI